MEPRFHAFDYLRCVAACGIVWFHADAIAPRRGIGYAGLPVFAVLTFFLLARTYSRRSFGELVRTRLRRLAVPFVAWSCFYAGVTWVIRGAWPYQTALDVLAGPSIHLWYLSFVLCASLLLAWLWSVAQKALVAYGLLAVTAVAFFALPADDALPAPLGQWRYALPAALVGVALGSARDLRERRWLAGSFTASALLLAAHVYARNAVDAISYAIGIPLAIAATLVELPHSRAAERMAELTLGVYLLHPFVFDVCRKLGAPQLGWLIGAGILGSAAATAVLRRFEVGRYVT